MDHVRALAAEHGLQALVLRPTAYIGKDFTDFPWRRMQARRLLPLQECCRPPAARAPAALASKQPVLPAKPRPRPPARLPARCAGAQLDAGAGGRRGPLQPHRRRCGLR